MLIKFFISSFPLQVKVNVLDKNDSPPTFRDLPLMFTVSEDLGIGQSVATISATDPDTIGVLEYSLITGDDGKFLLEKDTGVLKLRDTLDREIKDLYKLTIRVADGIQSTEEIVTLQVSQSINKNLKSFHYICWRKVTVCPNFNQSKEKISFKKPLP